MKKFLRNPPEWFLNVGQGVAIGMMVFGVGLMFYGILTLALLST